MATITELTTSRDVSVVTKAEDEQKTSQTIAPRHIEPHSTGRPWNSRFAVSFPEGAPASTVGNLVSQFGVKGLEGRPLTEVISVYPTQILEVAMGLVILIWFDPERVNDPAHRTAMADHPYAPALLE